MTCVKNEVMENVRVNVREQLEIFLELQRDNGKTLTKQDVANEIGLTGTNGYQRFRNCLSGKCDFKVEEIAALADLFDVSTDKLITGEKKENRTIAKDLGLSDSSVDYLMSMKDSEYDYPESFITTAEEMAFDPESITIPPDKPVVEGGTSYEILFIINYLLSHTSGHNLLSMISKYCLIDTSQGWVYDHYADYDSSFPFEECDEIYFRNRSGDGWEMVNPGILRYALIPAITNEVNRVRDEIVKGGEKDNGKKKRNHEKTGKQ